MKKRFDTLDGLRGVCAIAILLHHLVPLLGPTDFISHGYIAVDAFFVISGFVIAASYEDRFRNGLTVGAFIKARINRLGPIYWLGLVLGAISMGIITMAVFGSSVGTVLPLVAFLLILESVLIPSGGETSGFILNGPAWSLFAEFVVNFFYARLIGRLSAGVLVAIVAVGWGAALCMAFAGGSWHFGFSGNTILLSLLRAAPAFAAGVLIYRMWLRGWLARLPALSPLLLVGAWFALAFMPDILNHILLDAIAVIVVTPVLVACLVRTDQRSPAWFSTVGAMSYPLYTCQMPVILLVKYSLPAGADFLSNLLVVIPLAIFVLVTAWAVGRWFDPWARRMMNQWDNPAPAREAIGLSPRENKLAQTGTIGAKIL